MKSAFALVLESRYLCLCQPALLVPLSLPTARNAMIAEPLESSMVTLVSQTPTSMTVSFPADPPSSPAPVLLKTKMGLDDLNKLRASVGILEPHWYSEFSAWRPIMGAPDL